MSQTVEVSLNGEAESFEPGATLADAVERAAGEAGDARGVAVALDGEVVVRSRWQTTRLGDGQSVEVLRAIQGGAR